MRAHGLGVFWFAPNGAALFIVFIMAITLINIKGDLCGSGRAKNSNVADLETVYKGKEGIGASLAVEVAELKD